MVLYTHSLFALFCTLNVITCKVYLADTNGEHFLVSTTNKREGENKWDDYITISQIQNCKIKGDKKHVDVPGCGGEVDIKCTDTVRNSSTLIGNAFTSFLDRF